MTGWRRSEAAAHLPLSRRRPERRLTVLALCTAVAVSLLAGCGGVPGGTGGTRDPVTIMTWAPEGTSATNMPGMPAMAKAYARWVNGRGGIDGHRLAILTCNDHNTAAGAADCARRAVNENADAVVGSYSAYGQSFMPPLESAGIPYIGGYGLATEEFRSAVSYPVNGGQASLLAGTGKQLARSCRRVALVRPETVAGDELPVLLDTGLAEGHQGPATDISTTENAGEYTAQAEAALKAVGAGRDLPGRTGAAAAAARAAEGCVTVALGDRTQTFFDSFRRLERPGQKVRAASVLGSVSQGLIDRTGGGKSPYEGAYVTSWYPQSADPRWQPMRQVIEKFAFADNRIDPADTGVQTTWIAYTVLRQAIESLDRDHITADDLTHTLDAGLAVHTGGLTPTLRWRFADMLASRDFPRLVNRQVTYQVVRDGQLVALRKGAADVRRTLERASLEG